VLPSMSALHGLGSVGSGGAYRGSLEDPHHPPSHQTLHPNTPNATISDEKRGKHVAPLDEMQCGEGVPERSARRNAGGGGGGDAMGLSRRPPNPFQPSGAVGRRGLVARLVCVCECIMGDRQLVVGPAAAPKAAAPVVVIGGPTWLTTIFVSAQQANVAALSFSAFSVRLLSPNFWLMMCTLLDYFHLFDLLRTGRTSIFRTPFVFEF
jgi:hypothetical protein